VFALRAANYSLEEAVENEIGNLPNVSVSINSKFSDNVWDFTNNEQIRFNSVTDSKLMIHWSKYSDSIPFEMIESIKTVCYFFIKYPQVTGKRTTTFSRGYKPTTVVNYMHNFLKFIKSLCRNAILTIMNQDSIPFFKSFDDVSVYDLKMELERKGIYRDDIKRVLRAFCHPSIRKYLNVSINWTTSDIDQIKLDKARKNDNSFSDQPIDNELFVSLSKQATSDVLTFLKLMNIESHLKLQVSEYLTPLEKKLEYSFEEMFDFYVCLREQSRMDALNKGKRTASNSNQYKDFKKRFGLSINKFNEIIKKFHRAAIYIICQFVGFRYSEITSVKRGCLKNVKEGLWIISGTVTKGQAQEKLEDRDEWVACPIVRDAILVLEEIQRFTFNRYLISTTFSVYLNQHERPYSNGALNELLQLYLEQVDVDEKYRDPKHLLSSHRLRHTLASQLIKANLGIPYISYHLKHIHSQIVHAQNFINNVTLSYGNIAQNLVNNAIALNGVKKDIVKELYHPNSPIAGKNAEEFKERRKAFFQGWIAAGFKEDEIMEILSQKGVPFADVGLGYCGGKKEMITNDGKKKQPPCIGQLKCNPNQCGNALIPESKIPHWKEIYKHNKKMAEDPQFSHSKEEHISFMKEAKIVLSFLGVKVEEIV
jgi:integrase